MSTNERLPKTQMLEKILDHEGPIKWHTLDNNFNNYVRSRRGSCFVQATGEPIWPFHIAGTKKGDYHFGKTQYVFLDSDEHPIGWVDVPIEYTVGGRARIVFELTEDKVMHGWIKQSSQQSTPFSQSLPKTITEQVYERLIKSDNPETRKRAEQIRSKYSILWELEIAYLDNKPRIHYIV